MRAVQEFTVQEGIADIEGWITSGESKRGWTTALSGAVKCDTCAAKIVAIAPKVPIMPNIIEDIHYQWQSYNGFTFEFADYIDANITTRIDTPEFAQAMKYVDAINYIDEMADIPKFFIVSSSDEFAQIEWTNAYYDKFKGEMELFIVPNTEHHLNTDGGFDLVYSSLGQFVRSIAKGEEKRPTFDYEVNKESGEISVTIPKDQAQSLMQKVISVIMDRISSSSEHQESEDIKERAKIAVLIIVQRFAEEDIFQKEQCQDFLSKHLEQI